MIKYDADKRFNFLEIDKKLYNFKTNKLAQEPEINELRKSTAHTYLTNSIKKDQLDSLMGKIFLSAFFNKIIFRYINKYICILLMLTISFCFSAKILAEEFLSAETGKSEQRGFESRVAKPEPEFFFSGSSSELKGF